MTQRPYLQYPEPPIPASSLNKDVPRAWTLDIICVSVQALNELLRTRRWVSFLYCGVRLLGGYHVTFYYTVTTTEDFGQIFLSRYRNRRSLEGPRQGLRARHVLRPRQAEYWRRQCYPLFFELDNGKRPDLVTIIIGKNLRLMVVPFMR